MKEARGPCGLVKTIQQCCPNGLNSLWDSRRKTVIYYTRDNRVYFSLSMMRGLV